MASAVCEALDGAAPEPAPGSGFTDVAEDAWYHDVVQWVASVGAMTGYGDGTFGPDKPLSRAQLATVLWRMAGEPESSGELLPDCDPDAFYAGAAAWALETGLFTGYEDGTFGPADNITREQAATVMWRAAGLSRGRGGPLRLPRRRRRLRVRAGCDELGRCERRHLRPGQRRA